MPSDQKFLGFAIALMCLWGLIQQRWFLEKTRKGQAIVRKFGEARGLWVLRALFLAGALFGVLLALNVIRPMRW